jgi:hypothetical protein
MPKLTPVTLAFETLLMGMASTAVCAGVDIAQARRAMRDFADDDLAWRSLELAIPNMLDAALDAHAVAVASAGAGEPEAAKC